jgi:hypothetical protein
MGKFRRGAYWFVIHAIILPAATQPIFGLGPMLIIAETVMRKEERAKAPRVAGKNQIKRN